MRPALPPPRQRAPAAGWAGALSPPAGGSAPGCPGCFIQEPPPPPPSRAGEELLRSGRRASQEGDAGLGTAHRRAGHGTARLGSAVRAAAGSERAGAGLAGGVAGRGSTRQAQLCRRHGAPEPRSPTHTHTHAWAEGLMAEDRPNWGAAEPQASGFGPAPRMPARDLETSKAPVQVEDVSRSRATYVSGRLDLELVLANLAVDTI